MCVCVCVLCLNGSKEKSRKVSGCVGGVGCEREGGREREREREGGEETGCVADRAGDRTQARFRIGRGFLARCAAPPPLSDWMRAPPPALLAVQSGWQPTAVWSWRACCIW